MDTPERRQLRELTRAFVTREVLPHLDDWERAGEVPRELHATAARLGLLGIGFPESVGGSGGDLLDSIVVTEEIIRSGGSSGLVAALFTHGIALPHMVAAGDADLVDRYVRPTLAGGDDRRAGDHRAGRRFGRGRHPHHRPPRRRPLRGERVEDLHHQRRTGRTS